MISELQQLQKCTEETLVISDSLCQLPQAHLSTRLLPTICTCFETQVIQLIKLADACSNPNDIIMYCGIISMFGEPDPDIGHIAKQISSFYWKHIYKLF